KYSNSAAVTYRDPLENFTDREEILALFEQILLSAQAGQLRHLAIRGNSGTGKTFLLEYLMHRVCPALKWQNGQLSFVPDFRSILMGLEDAFKNCVPLESLEQYRI